MLATHIPAEFQVVGQNPVRQAIAIPAKLLAVRRLATLHQVEVFTQIFGFDVTERHVASGDIEIGRAAQDASWLVRSNDVLADGLKQRLERRAVRVLGSVAMLQVLAQRGEVDHKLRCGHGPDTLAAQPASRQERKAALFPTSIRAWQVRPTLSLP